MNLTPLNYPNFEQYKTMNKITHLEIWDNLETDHNYPLKNGKYILAYCTAEKQGFPQKQFKSNSKAKKIRIFI